ncbi:MAG: thioredoxin family protein [Armatimonadota bacterium]
MSEARQISGEEQFAAELAGDPVCVVEFWMKGCPACGRLAPVFAEVAEELKDRANLVGIEARENMAIAKQFGIRGVPTVIVFKAGQEVQRSVGAKDKDELRAWLEPALL